MPGGEGVLEVQDGEDEAEELPERHHQRDRQRGALSGQDEHATDAHVSGRWRSRLDSTFNSTNSRATFKRANVIASYCVKHLVTSAG